MWNGSLFVTVGGESGFTNTDYIYTSTDRISWQQQAFSTTNLNGYGFEDITRSGNLFVAVGGEFTTVPALTATSMDGLTWEEQDAGVNGRLWGVVWSDNQFVAVGEDGLVLTSADGMDWTQYN